MVEIPVVLQKVRAQAQEVWAAKSIEDCDRGLIPEESHKIVMIIPIGPHAIMNSMQLLRDVGCEPIPKRQKPFTFQESN